MDTTVFDVDHFFGTFIVFAYVIWSMLFSHSFIVRNNCSNLNHSIHQNTGNCQNRVEYNAMQLVYSFIIISYTLFCVLLQFLFCFCNELAYFLSFILFLRYLLPNEKFMDKTGEEKNSKWQSWISNRKILILNTDERSNEHINNVCVCVCVPLCWIFKSNQSPCTV